MFQPTFSDQLLACILPSGTLEWFEVTDVTQTSLETRVVLTEKNIPPLPPELEGKKTVSKGFKNITITDFPIRGKRASLVFRRRRWHVEGTNKLLTRDIQLCAPGTQLETEFASFLKDASRDKRRFFGVDC